MKAGSCGMADEMLTRQSPPDDRRCRRPDYRTSCPGMLQLEYGFTSYRELFGRYLAVIASAVPRELLIATAAVTEIYFRQPFGAAREMSDGFG